MNIHLTFITLLGLTGISAWAASAQDGNLLILLGLGCIKLLLVAFCFMELKHAHLFWKSAVVLLPCFFLTISWLVF
jgi:hypothetical protein